MQAPEASTLLCVTNKSYDVRGLSAKLSKTLGFRHAGLSGTPLSEKEVVRLNRNRHPCD
jgi:hypothetical protein